MKLSSIPVLVLYPHSRCNCRCIMCDIWKNPQQDELSATELQRHLADIEKLSVKWIVFSGGEPLMHSDLFRLSAMLRAKNIRVTVLTTGLLLKRFAPQIADGTDDLIVSLDGPADVHDGIRRIAGAFDRLADGIAAVRSQNPKLPIAARCTVQKRNHAHVVRTAQTAEDLELSSISFLAADLTSEAFNRPDAWDHQRQETIALTAEEISTLENEFRILLETWGATGFVMERADKLSRIVSQFRAHLGLCQPEAPKCNAPWVSAVIEANGTVRPCFFHPPVGSLQTHGLLEVLNGFEAQAFRRSLDIASNPTCRRCVCSLNWQHSSETELSMIPGT